MGDKDMFWKYAGNVATQYGIFVSVILVTVVGLLGRASFAAC